MDDFSAKLLESAAEAAAIARTGGRWSGCGTCRSPSLPADDVAATNMLAPGAISARASAAGQRGRMPTTRGKPRSPLGAPQGPWARCRRRACRRRNRIVASLRGAPKRGQSSPARSAAASGKRLWGRRALAARFLGAATPAHSPPVRSVSFAERRLVPGRRRGVPAAARLPGPGGGSPCARTRAAAPTGSQAPLLRRAWSAGRQGCFSRAGPFGVGAGAARAEASAAASAMHVALALGAPAPASRPTGLLRCRAHTSIVMPLCCPGQVLVLPWVS